MAAAVPPSPLQILARFAKIWKPFSEKRYSQKKNDHDTYTRTNMMKNENLIDKLHEADMLYFVLGSLISADFLIDAEACHKASDCLENLKRDFETSKLKEDLKLKSFLENADEIEQEIIQAGREIPQETWAKNHWYASSLTIRTGHIPPMSERPSIS